jgi:hypothetical protein
MDNSKKGGFVNRPPVLDDSNYDYWKVCMVTFLKSVDRKTWKAIIKGWEHLVVMDKDGKTTNSLKPKEDWSKDEGEITLGSFECVIQCC